MRRRIGRHDRGGAVWRCRGACGRTELGGAGRSRAHEVQARAEEAGGRHSHGEGDKLAQRRSRRAAGDQERLG